MRQKSLEFEGFHKVAPRLWTHKEDTSIILTPAPASFPGMVLSRVLFGETLEIICARANVERGVVALMQKMAELCAFKAATLSKKIKERDLKIPDTQKAFDYMWKGDNDEE